MKWRVYDIEWDKTKPDWEVRFQYHELPKETIVETGDFNGFYETDMERRQAIRDEIAEELIEAWDWCPNAFAYKVI